ncbi:MAG: hypothetical protein J5590_03340 [Clostridia bacterium]|nr:hypothetical protein [Clostridia bacterium]
MRDELDITKNVRLSQFIIADIIGGTSELCKRMAKSADSRDVAEALADIIIKSYLLSDTLGIGYPMIDTKVRELISGNKEELDKNFDTTALLRYLNITKG